MDGVSTPRQYLAMLLLRAARFLGWECPPGATRNVVLTKRHAFKFPRLRTWRNFLEGLLANNQERLLSARGYPQLCQVVRSTPLGLIIAMQRARPLTDKEWDDLPRNFEELEDGTFIPGVESEKPDTFGFLDGKIVIVDYGGSWG